MSNSSAANNNASIGDKTRVGVVGATGYTGSELLRLLLQHPCVELSMVTSRGDAGTRLDENWPNLRGYCDLHYVEPDLDQLAENCDVVFFATPHTVAMSMAEGLLARGCKIIDLSADFRIKDVALWEQWYAEKHLCPDVVAAAVYGLPEVSREQMRNASMIACPGCYPTAIQLGFLPLLENDLVDVSTLIANAASGVSGAGRQAKIPNLFAELNENFKAYGVSGHRHLPEIEQGLNAVSASPVTLTFVPHLLPTIRGIHATLYAKPKTMDVDWQQVYQQRYANEPFVDVLPAGVYPQIRTVSGTNTCQISVQPIAHSQMLCVMAVEDNLVKGAAGQAVQALNISCGWDETTGLTQIALLP